MEKTPLAKILIVDDEERNRTLLDVLLRTEGYHTIAAGGGAEALALAASEVPDAILLDLMMPDMDGFDVMHALKANPLTCAIPIMIASALDDIAIRRRLLESGAEELINKPVDRWELSLRLKRLLHGQGGAAGDGKENA